MYTKTHCNSKIYISGEIYCTHDFPDCMNLFDTVIMVYKEDMNIQDEEGTILNDNRFYKNCNFRSTYRIHQ